MIAVTDGPGREGSRRRHLRRGFGGAFASCGLSDFDYFHSPGTSATEGQLRTADEKAARERGRRHGRSETGS